MRPSSVPTQMWSK